jgi:hypothetical protein
MEPAKPIPTLKGEAVENSHFKFKKAEKLILRRAKNCYEQVLFVRKISEIHCIVVNANGMLESVMLLNLERSEQDEYESHRACQNNYAQSYLCVG